jgi:NAD(P)-dependent dehydrogenase (short-subunit alcohol dehydrogenase family)
MKKMLILGGTGGLGSQLANILSNKYDITAIGSKDLDIRSKKDCEEYFNINKFEIVLNLSGTNYDSFIHKLNDDQVESMIDVNIKGSINIVSACLKQMRQDKYGRIILISSILAQKNVMGTSVYSSCKSFLDKFVKNISVENIGLGITANTLQLGYFDGGMTYKIPNDNLSSIRESIGLKRFGKIEELSNTINFIIENEYVTGTNIKIDGGIQ